MNKYQNGKILWVDLSTRDLHEEPVTNYPDWLGGRALGTHLISTLSGLASDVPETQPVVIAAGTLAGTSIPLSTRTTILARNLLSDGFSFSNVGGDFGTQMRRAGYDQVIIQGCSADPVFLLLKDGKATLVKAEDLWGLRISELQEVIRQRYGNDASQLAIGPAGEAQVRIACLMADRGHAAGWGGNGAIFGAKKLKAIVAIGNQPVPVAHEAELEEKIFQIREKIEESVPLTAMRNGGTHRTAGAGGDTGLVPSAVHNIMDEYQPPDVTHPIQEKTIKPWETKRVGCYDCIVNCLHVYNIDPGDGDSIEIEGMHANSVRGFGPNLEVMDPKSILLMHWHCNEYGLDVDGVSSSLAFALECAQNAVLDKNQPDGVRLEWGDGPSMVRLVEQIGKKEGLGKILGEGAYRAAESIGKGSDQFAVTVKKVGINEQGIRSHRAWSLGIQTSTRGGSHLGGSPQTENRRISPEDGIRLVDNPEAGIPHSYQGKGKLVAQTAIDKVIVDSLGLCYFAFGWYDLNIASVEDLSDLHYYISGIRIPVEKMRDIGLLCHSLERYWSYKFAGITRKDDKLPDRFFEVPVSSGPYQGAMLDRKEVEKELDEYYQTLGWDITTGVPFVKNLENLGYGL